MKIGRREHFCQIMSEKQFNTLKVTETQYVINEVFGGELFA